MGSENTAPFGRANRRPRWLIQLYGGSLELVDDVQRVRDLAGRGVVREDSPVYEVGAGPRALGDVLELAGCLAPLAVQQSSPSLDATREETAPPVRQEARSPEHLRLSEELAILDRPLEDDVEYYDPEPRRMRLAPAFASVLVVAALGGLGYVGLTRGHLRGALAADMPNAAADSVQHATASSLVARPSRLPPTEAAEVVGQKPPTSPSLPRLVGEATPRPHPQASEPEPESDAFRPPTPSARTLARGSGVRRGEPARRYDRLVATADRLLEHGQTQRAAQLYRQALAERATGPEALTGLAYAKLDRGLSADAVNLFKQAIAHAPGHAPALFGLGEAYREQGRRDLAVAAFRRYLDLRSSGGDAEAARHQLRQLAPSPSSPPS